MFSSEDGKPDLGQIPSPQFMLRRFLEEPEFKYHTEAEQKSFERSGAPDETANMPADATEETAGAPVSSAGPLIECIRGAWAYKWLVKSLQREATHRHPVPNVMQEIWNFALDNLSPRRPPERDSRQSSQTCKAIFYFPWDPYAFIAEQGYIESPDEALCNAITLTGDPDDAQALTAEAYLCQVWPMTGEHVMRLLKQLVRTPKNPVPSKCKIL
jgi:hypothetical protein